MRNRKVWGGNYAFNKLCIIYMLRYKPIGIEVADVVEGCGDEERDIFFFLL